MERPLAAGPTAGKDTIRKRIWDYMEAHNIADWPRPVHNRLPNFTTAPMACDRLCQLEAFINARVVEVNPDKPQEQARFRCLEMGKTLYVPTPRLRDGLLNRIIPPVGCSKAVLRECAKSIGIKKYSKQVGMDSTMGSIDMIIIGSVAVSEKGYRIGKGEGYAEFEYALMRMMDVVTDDTSVVTCVHDCQVVDIPGRLMAVHDLPVDLIVTPTRLIHCPRQRKPHGIIWSLLTKDKIDSIPVLQLLLMRERAAGVDVRLKDDKEQDDDKSSQQHSQSSPASSHDELFLVNSKFLTPNRFDPLKSLECEDAEVYRILQIAGDQTEEQKLTSEMIFDNETLPTSPNRPTNTTQRHPSEDRLTSDSSAQSSEIIINMELVSSPIVIPRPNPQPVGQEGQAAGSVMVSAGFGQSSQSTHRPLQPVSSTNSDRPASSSTSNTNTNTANGESATSSCAAANRLASAEQLSTSPATRQQDQQQQQQHPHPHPHPQGRGGPVRSKTADRLAEKLDRQWTISGRDPPRSGTSGGRGRPRPRGQFFGPREFVNKNYQKQYHLANGGRRGNRHTSSTNNQRRSLYVNGICEADQWERADFVEFLDEIGVRFVGLRWLASHCYIIFESEQLAAAAMRAFQNDHDFSILSYKLVTAR